VALGLACTLGYHSQLPCKLEVQKCSWL
jgi:hypothetical protein